MESTLLTLNVEFLKWNLPVDEQGKFTISINKQAAAKKQAKRPRLDHMSLALFLFFYP